MDPNGPVVPGWQWQLTAFWAFAPGRATAFEATVVPAQLYLMPQNKSPPSPVWQRGAALPACGSAAGGPRSPLRWRRDRGCRGDPPGSPGPGAALAGAAAAGSAAGLRLTTCRHRPAWVLAENAARRGNKQPLYVGSRKLIICFSKGRWNGWNFNTVLHPPLLEIPLCSFPKKKKNSALIGALSTNVMVQNPC